MRGAVGGEAAVPVGLDARAGRRASQASATSAGNLERRVGPAELGAYARDLLGAERLAVRVMMPGLVGSPCR